MPCCVRSGRVLLRRCARGRRGKAARRQGGAVRLDLHAARRRHRRPASSPSTASTSRRRPRPATPSCSRRLTADSIDIGIGSGPGMAFMAKGVPAKAVAVMYGVPKQHGGDGRLQFADQDRRRPQGQEARLHHRRLADPLDRRPHQPRQRAGARPASPWCRSAACRRPAPRSRPTRSTAISARSKPATALEEAKEWRVITSADAVRR